MSTPGAPELKTLSVDHPILFFDGVCGLCNSVVDWVLARDPEALFRFAPLQGEAAASLLSEAERQDLATVVVFDRGVLHRRSRAIAQVLWRLGGVWRIAASFLWLTPRPVRDFGYRVIAKFRYRLFGQRETCRLPTKDERTRFLD